MQIFYEIFHIIYSIDLYFSSAGADMPGLNNAEIK